jgi:uncharacterized cofD-like protein
MKLVCIGGGHGLAQVLTALRPLDNDMTAIISTTDNGGSTGKLREAKNCIAYGDIRRCILSLANPNNLLSVIAEQRFEDAGELSNHALGNLILLALSQVTKTPTQAIYWLCQLLEVQQTILPMSNEVTDLSATLLDGTQINGECEIDSLKELPDKLTLTNPVAAPEEAISAILEADFVFMGPGSLLTSVLPVLLVENIQKALKSTMATRIFIGNKSAETSVASLIKNQENEQWASKILGFKFYDLILGQDAIMALDNRLSHFDELNKDSGLHDVEQLQHVLKQLICSKPQQSNVNQFNTQVIH